MKIESFQSTKSSSFKSKRQSFLRRNAWKQLASAEWTKPRDATCNRGPPRVKRYGQRRRSCHEKLLKISSICSRGIHSRLWSMKVLCASLASFQCTALSSLSSLDKFNLTWWHRSSTMTTLTIFWISAWEVSLVSTEMPWSRSTRGEKRTKRNSRDSKKRRKSRRGKERNRELQQERDIELDYYSRNSRQLLLQLRHLKNSILQPQRSMISEIQRPRRMVSLWLVVLLESW